MSCTLSRGQTRNATELEKIHLELTNYAQLSRQLSTRKRRGCLENGRNRDLGGRGPPSHWAKRVMRKLHCTKAVSLGNRHNTQLRKGKATGVLAPRKSRPKAIATKGCTLTGLLKSHLNSAVLVGEISAVS